MNYRRSLIGALLLCYIGGAQCATLVLEQGVNGFSGTADTSLFEDRRDNSSGGFPNLFSGVTLTNSPRRTLIKFDLPTTLTASAVITSVSLRLVVDRARPILQTHTLRKMTRTWNEGNLPLTDVGTIGQGATSQPGDATWNSAADGLTSWTLAGGDFAGGVSGSGSVDIAGTTAIFTGTGMVQDVQAWINAPLQNYGWIILGNESSSFNAKRFVSSEGTVGERPRLTLTFTPPTAAEDWQFLE